MCCAHHSGSCGLSREFLCHETIYEGAVDHQTDEESGALDTYSCKSYGKRVYACSGGSVGKGIDKT